MKIKRGTSRTIDAAKLVASREWFVDQDADFAKAGYTLKPTARAYACRDGTLSVQLSWTRKIGEISSTHTLSFRVQP